LSFPCFQRISLRVDPVVQQDAHPNIYYFLLVSGAEDNGLRSLKPPTNKIDAPPRRGRCGTSATERTAMRRTMPDHAGPTFTRSRRLSGRSCRTAQHLCVGASITARRGPSNGIKWETNVAQLRPEQRGAPWGDFGQVGGGDGLYSCLQCRVNWTDSLGSSSSFSYSTEQKGNGIQSTIKDFSISKL
jgi:hypothetical protein